ncbi:MAG TPA: MarR family winged helix-turn-helix transcriptional regulator [Baekduia sp.]|nr:MarR family winged helix-turn-helix transcriptional regulator [Baekduia sp.]
MSAPSDADYERLLGFRTELRRFVLWSETAARDAGLTPALHQLLLAVRGQQAAGDATVGSVAEALLVRHHTAVELAQRAEERGLIVRAKHDDDHRRVHLTLTELGAARLDELSREHLERIGPLAQRLGVLSAV